MRSRLVPVIATLLSIGLGGCANQMSIHHTFKPDDGSSISIDAKQRIVFSLKKTFKDGVEWRAVCAEPSPDALSAISASSGLSAEQMKIALSAAFGVQEGAASIGLRTQTIQILRDAMYRLCEGYASGALDDISFGRLQRRYQNVMLGLLAIEQLTGTVVPKQAILSGSASASTGSVLTEINKALDQAKGLKRDSEQAFKDADATRAAAEDALKAAEGEYKKKLAANNNDPKADEVAKYKKEHLDPAQAKLVEETFALNARKAVLSDATDSVAALEKAIDAYSQVMAKSITQGQFDGGSHATTINTKTASVISRTVQGIVHEIVARDYSKESCMDALVSRYLSKEPEQFKLVVHYCATLIQADIARLIQSAAQAKDSDRAVLRSLIESSKVQQAAFTAAINAYTVPVIKPATDSAAGSVSPKDGATTK